MRELDCVTLDDCFYKQHGLLEKQVTIHNKLKQPNLTNKL